MPLLEVENVSISFGDKQVLEDVSVYLDKNELVSILGLSGSGKTTLFNIISGLIAPQSGRILIDESDVTGQTGHVSYMLQKDLLMPHKKVIDNVALPLVINGMKKSAAREKAAAYFDEFGLSGTEMCYPSELSGGMRQRAAFLRTYLSKGKMALLDEPFSALDTITKSKMHEWYIDIMKKIQLSTLFITHDIDEAIQISDRIYILGSSPAHITAEMKIARNDVRNPELLLKDEFLKYKREIIEVLSK